jgi:hypothetical protein
MTGMRGAVTAVKKLNRSRICEANVTGTATLASIVEMTPLATIAAMEQEVARMNKAQRAGINHCSNTRIACWER